MGTRIHKMLGYGLTDVHCPKYRIEDPRINPDSLFFSDYDDFSVEAYVEWVKENRDLDDGLNTDIWMLDLLRERRIYAGDVCVHQAEYGLRNVLVLRPVSQTEWARYDDMIDYVEETHLRSGQRSQANHFDLLPTGIFPYDGLFMDARTGERIDLDRGMSWRHALRRYDETMDIKDKKKIRSILEEYAKTFGFEGFAEARENIVPVVPHEIRDLADYGSLFTDDTVWRQLRPMLYVYWS